jgi:hypothetical protein
MSITSIFRRAVALTIALALSVPARAGAQVGTAKPVSEKRIPVKKDQGKIESGGEVALATESARIDALDAMVFTLRDRIGMLERSNATLTSRNLVSESELRVLTDSLELVKRQLVTARAEFIGRTAELSDSVYRLNQSLTSLRYGSLFGQTGIYVGAGTGAGVTMGTLKNIGYRPGLNVVVPIGWQKAGNLIGIRTEWALQTFQGRLVPQFANRDPVILSGNAMVTLHLPFNEAKTSTFYLMGGGGAYYFRDVGPTSALVERLGNKTSVTKFGLMGGAGLEFHVLGATSLFVESAITNVYGERGALDNHRNLRWVPVSAGIVLR